MDITDDLNVEHVIVICMFMTEATNGRCQQRNKQGRLPVRMRAVYTSKKSHPPRPNKQQSKQWTFKNRVDGEARTQLDAQWKKDVADYEGANSEKKRAKDAKYNKGSRKNKK